MRKTENFNSLAIFNNNFKVELKNIFTSDIVRLTAMATFMAIVLYAMQFINVLN